MRNGKCYIGSTKNAKERKAEHFRLLAKGAHNARLQNAYNKEENKSVFEFQMFLYCKEKDLIALEQSCFNIMNPEYNISKIAGKIEMNEEVRSKISASGLIAQNRPEVKEKKSASGKMVQKEAQNKSGVNEKRSNTIKKLYQNPVFKKKQREASIEVLSKPETIEKKRKASIEMHRCPEFKKRHSKSLKNYHNRPEVKEKHKENFSGEKNPRARHVIELETLLEFKTITEAAKHYGISAKGISRVCLGQRKTVGPNKQKFKYL